MKALSRAIDKFCLKHRKFGIQRLMMYLVIISAGVFIINMMDTTSSFIYYLQFDPRLIVRGEIWRLVTWVFLPISGDIFTTAISLYFYYFIGSTLEREWGTPKFNIYYISGVLLNIVYVFIVWLAFGKIPYLEPSYLNLSMFFAFAVLFPDQVVRLFFIIPIKIKWLALLDAAFFVYYIVSDAVAGYYVSALLPVVAILNFLILCGSDLLVYLRPLRARGSKQTINFKREAKRVKRKQAGLPYRHKCAVCGKTDAEFPGLEFRYCSRCNGYHCFCTEHINNHVHFQ